MKRLAVPVMGVLLAAAAPPAVRAQFLPEQIAQRPAHEEFLRTAEIVRSEEIGEGVTKREEKYKAKAAIDTFFVRGGDTISALAVLAGTQLLGLKIERYALLNVAVLAVLLVICFKIIAAYKKRKAAADAAAAGQAVPAA